MAINIVAVATGSTSEQEMEGEGGGKREGGGWEPNFTDGVKAGD